MPPSSLCSLLVAAAVLLPRPAVAQAQVHPRWEATGRDFQPDGVWRRRGRAVARLRRELLARGRFAELNAPIARVAPMGVAPVAMVGSLRVPAVFFSYPGVDSAAFMRDPAQYQSLLFGLSAPAGLPYSLRSYYGELSNGLLDVPGQVIGWVRLDSAEAAYTGGQSSTCQAFNPIGAANCNGIFSGTAFARMQAGLREALAAVDPDVDFAQFDNDGPDGIPNSGDDDGAVDVIAFLHATREGACASATNGHLWAHRASLFFSTNDPSAEGGSIRVRDYILQSALGGITGCDSTATMAIGTMAHELGHGLGLPDLYDTNQQSEGIGQWGLMGSGNWASPRSPSRMEAWSLNELGWISLAPGTATGTYALGAVPTADSALLIRVQGANPRGEYFLLENRQAVSADTAMIRIHCQRSGFPPGCGGGLLIWHIDSVATLGGAVNSGMPHGVALVQADGLAQLDRSGAQGGNRGDAGDPYPGVAGRTAFGAATDPAAITNADGGFVGFVVDSIRQRVPGGEMAFRVRFGGLTLVRASDTAAVVVVRGDTTRVFRDLMPDGEVFTVAVPDTQLAPSGRARWRFESWSDGQSRVHDVLGSAAGDTLIATLARDFRVAVTVRGAGTVTATPAIDLAGTLLPEGAAVSLAAAPGSQYLFAGWFGDTAATGPALALTVVRPYVLTARFDSLLGIASATARPGAVMGAEYADTLRYVGGGPTGTWSLVGGALPAGVSLSPGGRIGGVPTATGEFAFTARVTSGPQTGEAAFTLVVGVPALATDAVVSQLLLGGGSLTVAEQRYLDLIGNRNGTYDVGDFKAWVDATGAPLTGAAAVLLPGGRR